VNSLSSGSAAAEEIACLRSDAVSGFYLGAMYPDFFTDAFDAVYGDSTSFLFTYNSIHSWPVVDGYVLTSGPLEAYASGISTDVVVTVGHNADEYTSFYASGPYEDYLAFGYLLVDHYSIIAYATLAPDSSVSDFINAHFAVAGETALLAEIDAYYSVITDPYQKAVHMATDAWFSTQQRLITRILIDQPGRVSGTVYKYIFGGDVPTGLSDYGMGYFGACHGCELGFVLGLYEDGFAYMAYGQIPVEFSAEQMTMGYTMKSFWLNMMYDGSFGTVGSITWEPITLTESHMIVFSADLPGGAALDPCVDFVGCKIDATDDYRGDIFYQWQDPTYSMTIAGPGVTVGPKTCCEGLAGPTMAAMGYSADCPVPETASRPDGKCTFCEDWCNFYTCGMPACVDCDVLNPDASKCDFEDKCAAWCNAYTCDHSLCAGCDVCDDKDDGEYCDAWCNAYLCPFMSGSLLSPFFAGHCGGCDDMC